MVVNEVLGANRIEIETGGYVHFDVQLTNSPHRHSHYEVCYVTSGAGRYHHGGVIYDLKPGDVFIADPGVTHEITSYDTKDLALFFVTMTLSRVEASRAGPQDDVIESFRRSHRVVGPGDEALKSYLPLVATGPGGFRNFAAREALKLFVLEMLSQLTTVQYPEEIEEVKGEMAFVMAYIDRNLRRRLSVEEIAQAAGISSRTLRRRFQQLSGTTVAQEINHRRMRWAAHRLLMGFPVSEVAEFVGINDPAQFTRSFVRAHGVTPKKFQSTYKPGRLATQTRP